MKIIDGVINNLSFNFINNLKYTFKKIISNFQSIDNYIIKSDDENIEILLENDEDKVKFQNEIETLIRENSKSKTIKIKNKNITISI